MNLELYTDMAFDTPRGRRARKWLVDNWHEWTAQVGSEELALQVAMTALWLFGFEQCKTSKRVWEEWHRVAGVGQRSQPEDRPEDICAPVVQRGPGDRDRVGKYTTAVGPVPREFFMFDNWISQCVLKIDGAAGPP